MQALWLVVTATLCHTHDRHTDSLQLVGLSYQKGYNATQPLTAGCCMDVVCKAAVAS